MHYTLLLFTTVVLFIIAFFANFRGVCQIPSLGETPDVRKYWDHFPVKFSTDRCIRLQGLIGGGGDYPTPLREWLEVDRILGS